MGGSKISSKITVIESLMNVCDKVILGGGMIFTFFKADGKSVGSSLVEDDKIELAKSLVELAKKKGVELILPVDVLAANKFAEDAEIQICSSSEIPDGEGIWIAFPIHIRRCGLSGTYDSKVILAQWIGAAILVWACGVTRSELICTQRG